MDRYFVFIDESGNSAFDKLQNENTFSGENYLIFGATVVNETDIDLIKKTLLSIKSSIKKETLHFTEIRKHYEKLYILKELSEKCSFTSFSVISNKKSLFKQNREYKPKNYIQFYNKNLIYLF